MYWTWDKSESAPILLAPGSARSAQPKLHPTARFLGFDVELGYVGDASEYMWLLGFQADSEVGSLKMTCHYWVSFLR